MISSQATSLLRDLPSHRNPEPEPHSPGAENRWDGIEAMNSFMLTCRKKYHPLSPEETKLQVERPQRNIVGPIGFDPNLYPIGTSEFLRTPFYRIFRDVIHIQIAAKWMQMDVYHLLLKYLYPIQ